MSLRARSILVIMAGFVSVFFLSGCSGDPVPDVTGQRYQAAEVYLERAGFRLGRVEYDDSARGPAGFVISQYPRADALATPGDDIDIVISGARLVRVPLLVGDDVEGTRSELKAADLRPGRVSEVYHDFIPAGRVISQSVRPGTFAPEDAPIELTVSLGPKDAPVPPVVGRWEKDARGFILDLGFKSRVEREASRQPEGVVIDQYPDAREKLDLGKRIDLTISRGPDLTAVPDVRGLEVSEAEKRLKRAGLGVSLRVSRGSRPGEPEEATVLSQEPVAGYRAPAGISVVLYLRRP